MKNPASQIPTRSRWIASIHFAIALLVSTTAAASELATARLCLTSTELPFAQGDPRIAILESKIAARFEEGHFSIVRGAPVLEVIEVIDARAQPAFDATTAAPIPGVREAYHAALGGALHETLGCEGRIRIRVESVLAPVDGGWAVWDGARISRSAGGRKAVQRSPEMQGFVAALSLWVELVDVEGRALAFRSAAIEPLVHIGSFLPEERRPDEHWLADEQALDAAIDRALGPKALYLRDRGNPTLRFPETSLVWPDS